MKIMRRSDEEDPAVSPARTPCLWHVCGTKPALAPGRDASLIRGTYPDLVFLGGAGEGNRTLMTSLEGVPRIAVEGADLHAGVSAGGRGLPLRTLANGTLMAR